MRIGDNVNKFADLKSADLSKHTGECRILADVPDICRKHILRALVENRIELVTRNVECHTVSAGIKSHFAQILMNVDIRKDSAALGIVPEVIENTVNLVHIALFIVMLDTELIAVCLAYAAVFVCPLIPDVAAEVIDIIGLFLPYPEYFVNRTLEKRLSQRKNRKLLRKIIAVDNAEFFYCVCGSAVFPSGADVKVGIPDSVLKNILAGVNKNFIGKAHRFILPVFL